MLGSLPFSAQHELNAVGAIALTKAPISFIKADSDLLQIEFLIGVSNLIANSNCL
jgi:hypothetical protein